MHEPEIAPLARRLAEENNVDWRRLSGSGDGGRIVERDVLAFLARVMAGEEAVDPTPEPVPDGMEAWPADDVASYGRRDDDAAASPPTLDDELFLFDEAPAPDVRPPAPADAPTASSDRDDDAVWLVGDDAPPAPPAPLEDAGEGLRYDDLPDLTADDVFEDAGDARRHGRGRDALDLPDLFATAADDAPPAPASDALFHEAPAAAAGSSGVADVRVVPDETPAPAAERVPSPGATGEAGAGSAAPAPRDAVAAPWVRHGQVWRRRFDDRALRRAASEAAAALDVPPATVVALLLARAVLRAGVGDGPVDALRWRDGREERRRTDWAADVRTAIQRLEVRLAHDEASPPALVVVDLSELDVDEAVLHLEAPVLALGRAVGEGAWLTFSGDDLDGSAAGGLARVAELLATPVRLLV